MACTRQSGGVNRTSLVTTSAPSMRGHVTRWVGSLPMNREEMGALTSSMPVLASGEPILPQELMRVTTEETSMKRFDPVIAVALTLVVTCACRVAVIPTRAAYAFTIFGDFSPSDGASEHRRNLAGQAKPGGPVAGLIRMSAPPEFGDALLGFDGEEELSGLSDLPRNLADDALPNQGVKRGGSD